MKSSVVVLLQGDAKVTNFLVTRLSPFFYKVSVLGSLDELRATASAESPDVALVDLEIVSMSEIERLCAALPTARIICNHRLADEKMWAAALGAGADDCVPSSDMRGLLDSSLRSIKRAMAA
jgi:DNA-binding response OmpR family regulator